MSIVKIEIVLGNIFSFSSYKDFLSDQRLLSVIVDFKYIILQCLLNGGENSRGVGKNLENLISGGGFQI